MNIFLVIKFQQTVAKLFNSHLWKVINEIAGRAKKETDKREIKDENNRITRDKK